MLDSRAPKSSSSPTTRRSIVPSSFFATKSRSSSRKHSSALQSIDLGQDPTLEVGTGTQAHGDYLQRTGHLSTSP